MTTSIFEVLLTTIEDAIKTLLKKIKKYHSNKKN